jgi:hypothetical protein
MSVSRVTDSPSAHGTERADPRGGDRARAAAGLVVLALGLALNSLLGPFVTGVVDYPLSQTLLHQAVGLDAVTLLVVAPLALAAGVLVRRGHGMGPVLGTVAGTYTVYMFVQFVIGPDYLYYPGALALHLALFVLGWWVTWRTWTLGDAAALPTLSARARRVHAVVLFLMAAFVVLRYVPGLLGAFAGEPLTAEQAQDPAMFWTIFLMDLGVFVPVAIGAGVGLLRGQARAQRVLYVAVGWFVLVTLAVTAMAGVMLAGGDPFATVGQTALFAGTAVVVVCYAVVLFGPVLFGPAVARPGRRAR